jgi:methylenetetrahydrofolate dehydrogenase (NADP+)/methenyltetrahydrofolate cyclohydrolase
MVDGKLVGDVAYDEVAEVASAASPVPGGVGPLTNLMLVRNVLRASELRAGATAARP